ncbi:MAG: carbon starvation CstA family protein [Nitrospirota bacterium]
MSIIAVALIPLALFLAAYRLYGAFLARRFALDDSRPTPACSMADGVDYIPTSPPILLAQHFSSIAAAGPIVGPILAALWFGWLPALLWIVLGCIFIGAAHDFANLVASIRHKARSIAELMSEHISRRAYLLFLAFIWLSLVYVIVAFTDLTASTFLADRYGPGVATSSFLYLLIAVLLGTALYRWRLPLRVVTPAALLLVVWVIWIGQAWPIRLPGWLPLAPAKGWGLLILGYCFVASVLPLWLLLQPRGYLGGYFLYGALLVALLGITFGNFAVEYPSFLGMESSKGAPLFPIMFITIACGACSGFHGLVCSGTTSKQLQRERHSRLVGYGGMLLEGVVALIALITVMMLAPGSPEAAQSPMEIYARGLAAFASVLGIPPGLAMSFGLLAFATFVYDTLDVATRLGRYILQELTGWEGAGGRIAATVVTLLPPLFFLLTTTEQAYLKFWPIFGASNQLLAALSLLGIAVWFMRTGRNPLIMLLPMLFIMVMTLWSLGLYAAPWIADLAGGRPRLDPIGLVSLVLIGLALLLIAEAGRVTMRMSAGRKRSLRREAT